MYGSVELNEAETKSLNNWHDDVYTKRYPRISKICEMKDCLTYEQLATFDGVNNDKILLSVKHMVFDVTKGSMLIFKINNNYTL